MLNHQQLSLERRQQLPHDPVFFFSFQLFVFTSREHLSLPRKPATKVLSRWHLWYTWWWCLVQRLLLVTPPIQPTSRGVFSFSFTWAHELQALNGYVLFLDCFLKTRKRKTKQLKLCTYRATWWYVWYKTEPWNLGCKTPLRSSGPTYESTAPWQPDHGHAQALLKHWPHLPGQLIPMPDHPFCEQNSS